jgi:TRAP-type C4-dicarboxylate transport system permease small subunit
MTPGQGMLEILDRRFEEALCGVFMSAISALMFLQVVMRYVFSSPLHWSDEIASYCMVWLVYFGAALAVRERAHIRVLNGVFLLPRRAALALIVAADLVWVAVNLLMVWHGGLLIVSLFKDPFVSPVLGIDQKWPYLVVPLAFVLMTVRLAQVYVLWWRRGVPLVKEGA